ncbi:hypothetical protein JCM33374_g5170 [Metschnikowia sp. JCM 33374]|nr:hypothetical protein JCM33374_g5170 [Metschnikowia sp. JCM 33374]
MILGFPHFHPPQTSTPTGPESSSTEVSVTSQPASSFDTPLILGRPGFHPVQTSTLTESQSTGEAASSIYYPAIGIPSIHPVRTTTSTGSVSTCTVHDFTLSQMCFGLTSERKWHFTHEFGTVMEYPNWEIIIA